MDIKSIGSHLNTSTISKAYTPSQVEPAQTAVQQRVNPTDKIEISKEARLKQNSEPTAVQNSAYSEKLNSGFYNSKQVASVIAEKMLVELSKM